MGDISCSRQHVTFILVHVRDVLNYRLNNVLILINDTYRVKNNIHLIDFLIENLIKFSLLNIIHNYTKVAIGSIVHLLTGSNTITTYYDPVLFSTILCVSRSQANMYKNFVAVVHTCTHEGLHHSLLH